MEPENPALDQYIVNQSGVDRPKIAFLSQASGEGRDYIINFFKAFTALDCRPSHLSLFAPHTADIENYLMEQNIIYVGGGNTKSMLALWREWGIDHILRQAGDNGTILAGISAGSICWFDRGLTDSIPGKLTGLPCMGYLSGSCSPHYDGEPGRRPSFQALIGSGELPAGVAFDDSAAGHYVDGVLKTVISSKPDAKGYRVERVNGQAVETVLETHYLLA